ncbi:hypothetical protein CK820_G0022473 [Pan troglodytes]|uniref:Uncharacterized protein n=1 Tax=Pan troglodytes TaxID=9598 RepID=A0A2J8M905_PANTR|nr:hypothetical protein CK820_G0022473 [Pan troglodytes]
MRRGLERWKIGESTADLPLTPGSGRRRWREDSTLPGADRDGRASQSERGSAPALQAAWAAVSSSAGICGAGSLAIPRYAMIFKHSGEPVLRLWLQGLVSIYAAFLRV